MIQILNHIDMIFFLFVNKPLFLIKEKFLQMSNFVC